MMRKVVLIAIGILLLSTSVSARYLDDGEIKAIRKYEYENGKQPYYGAWHHNFWREFELRNKEISPRSGFIVADSGGEMVAHTAPPNVMPEINQFKDMDLRVNHIEEDKTYTVDSTRKDTGYYSFARAGGNSSVIDKYDWQLYFYDEWWNLRASTFISGKSKFNLNDYTSEYPQFKNYVLYLSVGSGTIDLVNSTGDLIKKPNMSMNGNHWTGENDYTTHYTERIGVGPGEVHPSRILTFAKWPFNAIRLSAEKGIDLETLITKGGKYKPKEIVSVPATIRNNSNEDVDTVVSFDWEFDNIDQDVSLKAGEIKKVYFEIEMPDEENDRWPYEVTINKNKAIEEITYMNNRKKDYLETGDGQAPPSLDCPSEFTWTEIDGRMEEKTETGVDAEGNSYSYTYEEWVEYEFDYKATLDTSMVVKDDRELVSSPVYARIKSGYGFKVDVSGSVKVEQVSGEWARDRTKSINLPDEVKVVTSWTVRNINQIGDTTPLEKTQSNVGTWGGTFKYTTPVNPKSRTGAKVIYTDIDLAGSHTRPEKHYFDVKVEGVRVGTQSLCKDLKGYVEIFGDMYEDYRVN